MPSNFIYMWNLEKADKPNSNRLIDTENKPKFAAGPGEEGPRVQTLRLAVTGMIAGQRAARGGVVTSS